MNIFEETLMYEFRVMTYELDCTLFLYQVFAQQKYYFKWLDFFTKIKWSEFDLLYK